MVEEEVEGIILTADFEPDLPPDEGEAGPEFDEKSLDVIDERLLHLCLAAGIGGAEEVEEIRVFERLGSHVRLCRWHGEGEIVLGLADAEVELILDLNFQDSAAPTVGEGFADVKLTGGGGFSPLHDLENVTPRQLRNRLLRNWAARELPGEDLHGQEVTRGQPSHVREGFLKVGGKAVDDFGSPRGFLLAGENDFSGVPIRFDHNWIGRENGTDAGVPEVGLDLLKRGCVGLW